MKKEKPELPPLAEKRAKPRKKVLLAGVVVYGDGHYAFNCRVRDLTTTSARISLAAGERIPEEFYFINMKERTAHRARLVWRKNDEAGITLETSHDLRDLSDRKLFYLAQIWTSRNTVTR